MEEYVIKDGYNNFIAIDSASGGYPFATKYHYQAAKFDSKEKAMQYGKMFKEFPAWSNWSIHSIEIKVETMKICDII